MTNNEISKNYLKLASIILDEAKNLFRKQIYNLVVRRAQEVVELSTKAMLRDAAIEIPKEHDVGWLLEANRKKLPPKIQKELPKIRHISRQLRKEREASFYGDENTEIPPTEIYTQFDADQSLIDAEFVLNLALKK